MTPWVRYSYEGRGMAYLEMGFLDRAIILLNEALPYPSSNHLLWYNLGSAYVEKGEIDSALKWLSELRQAKQHRLADELENEINKASK